ncbi:MAG: hypothetical protein Q8M29_04075 [Bacteroidota bacterium]|nr:hypothetical protein [Bacteroidota bacterium]
MPAFNKAIFWDIDFENLDLDKYANWVIERVMDRGDVEDIRQCRRYYGDEKVKSALLNAKHISLNRIYLAAAIIDQPITNFKCYLQKQSNPGLSPY